MPLSWNEIRNRALEFSRRWEGEAYNNFPWPEQPSDTQHEKIEAAADAAYSKKNFKNDAERKHND